MDTFAVSEGVGVAGPASAGPERAVGGVRPPAGSAVTESLRPRHQTNEKPTARVAGVTREGLDTAGSCAGWNRQAATRAARDSAQVTVLRVPKAPPRNENSRPPGSPGSRGKGLAHRERQRSADVAVGVAGPASAGPERAVGGVRPPAGSAVTESLRPRHQTNEKPPEGRLGLAGLAGPKGLEPSTSGVTGRRSNQLNYDPAIVPSQGWWEVGDLNPRLPACKAGALPLS